MILAMKESQLDAVMRIWMDANIAAHPFVGESFWRNSADEVRATIATSTVYVYEDQGVRGFIGITGRDYIAGLFVEVACQGQGIGKALLDYAKQRYDALELDVYKANNRAVQFYLRNDFAIEQEKMHMDESLTEYLMKWRLEEQHACTTLV